MTLGVAPGDVATNVLAALSALLDYPLYDGGLRRAEVTAAAQANRLVTLTGLGGVGKTRLALDCARAVAGAFPGGSWFVDLAAVSEPSIVLATVGAAVGVRVRPGGGMLDTVAAWELDSALESPERMFLRTRAIALIEAGKAALVVGPRGAGKTAASRLILAGSSPERPAARIAMKVSVLESGSTPSPSPTASGVVFTPFSKPPPDPENSQYIGFSLRSRSSTFWKSSRW